MDSKDVTYVSEKKKSLDYSLMAIVTELHRLLRDTNKENIEKD